MNKKLLLIFIFAILLVGIGTYIFINLNGNYLNAFEYSGNVNSISLKSIFSKAITLTDTEINYKNSNMTVEFKDGLEIIGEATLKSHRTYDEVLKVSTGNRVLVWYEFSEFKDAYADVIGDVKFIDMRKTITNKTYLEEVGGLDNADEKKVSILNPDYLQPVEKEYEIVYLDGDDWKLYTSKQIPIGNIFMGIQADIGWGEYLDVIPTFFENDLNRHAIVIGTSAGFVTVRPSGDPVGDQTTDGGQESRALNDTTPASVNKVTEIGFWATSFATGFDTQTVDVGIYTDDGEPNILLAGSDSFLASGEDQWHYMTVDIDIDPETDYWIGIYFTGASANYDMQSSGATSAKDADSGGLLNPWGTGTTFPVIYGFYAVVEEIEETPPNVTIYSPANISYSTPINFTISSIDNEAIGDGECWVTITSGTSNISMLNTTDNPSFYNYTAPAVYSNGGYLAEFYCNDTVGNLNDTESIAFAVDIGVTPYLNIPTNDTRTALEVDDFEFNMSITGDWFNYTFIVWDGAGSKVRERQVENGTIDDDCFVADSGDNFVDIECTGQDIITDGNYEWNVYGCSVSEICSYSLTGNYTFILDGTNPLLNIVFPTNNTNHSTNTLNVNFTRSDTNLESCWYSNDTFLVNTTLASCTNISGATEVTWSEGGHHIRIWVNDSAGNEVVDSVTFSIDSINPDLNITFPINNTNWSNVNLNVNFTRSDTNLFNCWYSNDTYLVNKTLDTDCKNVTAVVWSEGQHNVTVWANDTFDNENASRISFTIDTTAPAVNITYPFNTVDYQIIDTNLTINYTSSDPHLDSCWGSFDGGTNNLSLTCADQNITINVTSLNNDTFTFWANDTFGNEGIITRTWIYKIFEVEQTFSSITIPGSTETFVNNIFLGSGETITEVNFNYDGTDRSAGYSDLGGNEYNLSSTFVIPSVAAATNITFFWKIDLISGQINTSSKNQSIRNIAIDDCSVFPTLIFNYTIIDEETQVRITPTAANATRLELDIEIFDTSKTILILNFSQEYVDTNPATVCLNINLTEETVYAFDSTAKYKAANYSIEYYNLQNFQLQNSTIPQHIKLFDLKLADTTEFQITFKDSNFVTVENALVQINRQYLSEGVFKTVEIPKTDSNGQTVAHLVEKDVVYNIIVLKEGEVLGIFNNVIAFCEDILIGSCFITLNALVKGEVSFDYDEEIELFYDFDYNETSRNLRFDFTTTDGSVKNVTLSAIKFDQLGDTAVCDGFLISSGGSIYCPVPISVGNESIIISIWVDGDLKITNYVRAGREFDIGDAGFFLMFFLVLSLALMMTQSKTGVIIGVILGFIAGTLLSFIQGGLLGIGSSVIWLIIMGVILIYKLNSQGQT